MIIIIDGYNVLKAVHKGKDISQKVRASFITSLGRYGSRLKHKIVLVFDGGSYEWVHKERINGVHIVYSGFNETADDYIKYYIKKYKTSDLLLVSSDNELSEYATRFQRPSIGGYHFYQLMFQELQKAPAQGLNGSGAVKKISLESLPELDELMEQASKVIPVKSEDVASDFKTRLSSSRKGSKIDRKLLQKLKKL